MARKSVPSCGGYLPEHPLALLPTELLEWILQYLPSDALFNLRLSSREFADMTEEHMSQRFFGELHVLMMERDSMKRLMRVVAHPVYGPEIRKIEFNTAVLVDQKRYEVETNGQAEDIQSSDTSGDDDSETSSDHMSSDDDSSDHGLEYMNSRSTDLDSVHRRIIYKDHIEFRDHVQGCMTAVLQALDHGTVPEIKTVVGCLWPIDPALRAPWGIKRLIRDLGRDYINSGVHELDRKPHEILCRAIFESACAVNSLTLGDHYHAFDPWTIGPISLQYQDQTPFKHLRRLTLHLKELRLESELLEGEKLRRAELDLNAARTCVLWLVAQAEQLESLAIHSKNFYLGDYVYTGERRCDAVVFRSLVSDKHAQFPKQLLHLKNLCLHGHDIPKQMLIDFVHNHKATLRSLELWEITNEMRDDPDIKADVFAAAHDIQGFKLKIGRVYEGGRLSPYPNDHGQSLEWETYHSQQQPPSRDPSPSDE